MCIFIAASHAYVPRADEPPPWIAAPQETCSMNNLEQLAALLFDVIDPQEFDAVAAAVGRFKTEDQASYSALMCGGCKEFATLFGPIERATRV
jgi:hypothetical protein